MSLSVKPNKNNRETTMTPIKPKNENIKETMRAPLVSVEKVTTMFVEDFFQGQRSGGGLFSCITNPTRASHGRRRTQAPA
jgi:hypothetical protein